MKRTIWLASYPKSGNTWVRMLIANLAAPHDQPVDINDLPERGGIVSGRVLFDNQVMVDSGLLTHDEIDRLRPRVYEAVACGAADEEDDEWNASGWSVRFMKVHDAYTLNAAGDPLLAGARGASGAIVIIRDPRDVAPSLAMHLHTTVDLAIDFMNDNNAAFCMDTTLQPAQLRQKLLGWSGHVASWLNQPDLPVHTLRYEDLHADPAGTLQSALDFANCAATGEAICQAVKFAEFAELRRQEDARGFREGPRCRSGRRFFRRGKTGGWRDELTADQVARIESAHAPMMQQLGYELSGNFRQRVPQPQPEAR